ncbi:MAG: hypothetical protein GXO81_10255 [Chlorobi bacterium]|nr:hypothetical protein [Chlorobiota bacterium]
MKIKEIKVGGLASFIESEEYRQLNPKPVTKERAISQFNNPNADSDHTALIYVAAGTELLGFAGLLPRKINRAGIPVFSNTCWWTHPQKGKGLAIPLILKIIEESGSSLYLAESTPGLKSILEKTGKFEFSGPIEGIRGFIRFYFADIFLNRFQQLKYLSGIVSLGDVVLNFLTAPFRFYFQKKFEKGSFETESLDTIGREVEEFINQYSETDFIQKAPEDFEWFKKFPWLTVSTGEKLYDYPFSHVVKQFGLEYFVLKKEGVLKAFVAISNRDNLARIPYIYFDKDDISNVVQSVMSIILKKRCDSLVVFHPGIVEYMKANRMPFLYRKKEIKFTGVTKSLYEYFMAKPYLQDGDGDVVFT